MGLMVLGSDGSAIWGDATSKAMRVRLYDGSGNPIGQADQGAWTPTDTIIPVGGSDYKQSRVLRTMSDGSLPQGRKLAFNDPIEGATLNSVLWTNTNTTMTVAQATGLITLNNSAIGTTTTGNLLLSNKSFPILQRGALVFRSRQRHTAHNTNNLIEIGFGTTASATAAGIGTGACWRKDGTGQYVPVISIVNGTETLGTPISNATFLASVANTEYALFEVVIEHNRCTFRIYESNGDLVNEQALTLEPSTGNFQATHVQAMIRLYHVGASGATQALLSSSAVWIVDHDTDMPWSHTKAGMSHGLVMSPTAFTQLANYANSAVPATGTPSNTAAGYTTLGGQFAIAAVAGAETDLAMFAFTVPAPYQMFVTGIRIACVNTGAAVATTPTLLQWSIADSAAVTLASNTNRQTLGFMSAAVAAAVGATYDKDIDWKPGTPFVLNPGRIFHIILKVPVGTATGSQLIRGVAAVDGYFQ